MAVSEPSRPSRFSYSQQVKPHQRQLPGCEFSAERWRGRRSRNGYQQDETVVSATPLRPRGYFLQNQVSNRRSNSNVKQKLDWISFKFFYAFCIVVITGYVQQQRSRSVPIARVARQPLLADAQIYKTIRRPRRSAQWKY